MRIPLFTLLLFSLLLSLHVTPQTTQEPAKPTYFPTGNEANVLGTITLKGKPPKPRIIDMTADPSCLKHNRKPRYDLLTTNEGRLQNAFIYLKSEKLDGYQFAMPESDVILNQRGCFFEPHVFGLRVGQTLRIINADPTQHNVHPTPKLNQEWNQTQAEDAPPMVKTFRRAEVMVPIKCNHHPWMKTYAGVMNHPFFAVSDSLGRFEIRGLPEGTYKLVVWHELFGEQEIEITLVPGESRNADFTFDVEKMDPDMKYRFEPES